MANGSSAGVSLESSLSTSPQASPVRDDRAPVAERRLVSVLFADLVGFTTLSESRDAEDVRELLTRYFEVCRRLIELYGGTVEKFIGDAVMAVWGTPTTQEDDAERAVRAALDLTESVADLGMEVGAPDLLARAGVLTGEAAVTLGAEGQGMVAGDLVNTASRIQAAAPPGSVYVGEVTRRATEAAISYEEAGVHELKGKAEPVPLWRAMRVVAGVRGSLKSERLEPPFVGREGELRTVKERFFSCGEDRKAHLVSIVGIAGIGKSRLAWEFYKYFDGLPQVTWYHRGRCLAYGDGVAYWALAEMVRMRARIAEGEDPVSSLAKLRATVEEHVKDPEERRWVWPRLAHLIGLEERTATDREDLFAAWRLFFERLAETNPTVMVFEDMQWADASMLDFIDYLLEWSRNYPIFILTLARPELLERRPTWGAGTRNFTSVYLEPLDPEAMEHLLAGLVPGLPDELRTQILKRAEGVPLYAVETVRMLLDRGLLVEQGNVYGPTGPIEALEVPETLHALIAARLDGVSAEERRLIQDASVLGKTFFRAGLAAVSGMSEPQLDQLLASLVRKEVLGIQGDSRSPEHGQYGFLQDLMRWVAYETLPKKERKARHLAAAAYLESAWGEEEEEIVEVVASHFLEAYAAAPDAPDAPEIKRKARDMLTLAGERAASLAATTEAQRYFDRAAEYADDPMTVAGLLERAGQMAFKGGRLAEARTRYEEAIRLFESEGAAHPAARVSARLGDVDQQDGRREEGLARMEPAFGVLRSERPSEELARLAAQLGRAHYLRGELDRAMEVTEVALDISERLRLPEVLAHALITEAGVAAYRGRPETTLALVRQALQIALDSGIASAALRAYNNLGFYLQANDRYDEQEQVLESALELARKVGDRPWEWTLTAGQIYLFYIQGRWDEALRIGQEIRGADLALFERVSGELPYLASLLIECGQLDEAREILDSTARWADSDDLQLRAGFGWVRARVLRAEGRNEEALASARASIALGPELSWLHTDVKDAFVQGLEAAATVADTSSLRELLEKIEGLWPGERSPILEAQASRFRGRLAWIEGDQDRVPTHLKPAAGAFREIGTPFWLAVTLLEHAEWLGSQERLEEAHPLLAEAGEIFERLQAKPWLERLEKAPRPAVVG